MDWFKKHADTVVVMTGIIGSFLWMNTQINSLNNRLYTLEKDVAIIKTVLVMNKIMPNELYTCQEKPKDK